MAKKNLSINAAGFAPDTTDIERELLATAIADSDSLPSVLRIVRPSYFSDPDAKKIYEVIVDRYDHHYSVNAETLLPCVDRGYFISNIVSRKVQFGLTTTTDLAYTLARAYEKRIAFFQAVEVLRTIDNGGECSAIRALFEGYAAKVDDATPRQAQTLQDAATDVMDDLQSGKDTSITTGIPTIDQYLNGGWHGGTLNIVAARPSVGKTALTLQFAQTAASIGEPVLFFSLEMSAKELAKRAMIASGKVSAMDFYYKGKGIDWQKFEEAIATSISDKVLVNDHALTLSDITADISRYCQQGKVKMVVIDYLGLIALASSSANIVQQLAEITRRLKLTAKQYDIPIILLCQLSRASAAEHRSPELFDLRDSGSIEQDADVVLMLEHAEDAGVKVENAIDLWIRKNRAGKRNFDAAIRLQGDAHYSNFKESIPVFETPVAQGEPNWASYDPFDGAGFGA